MVSKEFKLIRWIAALLHLLIPLQELASWWPRLDDSLDQRYRLHPIYFRVESEVAAVRAKLVGTVELLILQPQSPVVEDCVESVNETLLVQIGEWVIVFGLLGLPVEEDGLVELPEVPVSEISYFPRHLALDEMPWHRVEIHSVFEGEQDSLHQGGHKLIYKLKSGLRLTG